MAALIGLVVVVGLVLGVRWWTSPSLFRDSGAGFVADPVPVSRFPLYVGVGNTNGVKETIVLHSARMRWNVNEADATATFFVCTQRPVADGHLILGTLFESEDPLSKYCTKTRPVRDGVRMKVDDDNTEYLVARIQPRTKGMLRFGTVELSYTRSWRHARQQGTDKFREFQTYTVS